MGQWDSAYDRGFADQLYSKNEKPSPPAGRKSKKKTRRKRRFGFMKLLLILLVILFFGIALLLALAEPPVSDVLTGTHKPDAATVLLAGTDESGLRTDTIMLMNIDRSTERISLLSIPRDTKVNSRYTPHKINGAYGVNGTGEEGMEALLDYVQQCVGFRPDGYVLLELDVFIRLVDLMGEVSFEVPCDMDYEDPSQDLYIHLKAGLQELNGEQAMGLVRYRSGYSMADITRVSVQRDFLMAALEQWTDWTNFWKLPSAVNLLMKHSLTNMSAMNLLWLAQSAVICGTEDMEMRTIPFYLDSVYVIIDDDEDYFEMINEYFNPYEENITQYDVNIAK